MATSSSSPALSCLTLDLVTMQPLGEWNWFTNFKSRNKKKEEYLSDERTDSLPCSHIITRADQSRRTSGGEQQHGGISPCSDSSHQIQHRAAHRDLLMHTLNQQHYTLVPEAVLDWPAFPHQFSAPDLPPLSLYSRAALGVDCAEANLKVRRIKLNIWGFSLLCSDQSPYPVH